MFTGLIQSIGTVKAREETEYGVRFSIEAPFSDHLQFGESVAVDGACLTVELFGKGTFEVVAVPETLALTTLKNMDVGRRVNLERALQLGDRLGGHLVQGHVDGVGTVKEVIKDDSGWRVCVQLPSPLMKYVAKKGSITMDGVSLTVSTREEDGFEVVLIPTTLEETTLNRLDSGDRVNVEVDLMARYAEHLIPQND